MPRSLEFPHSRPGRSYRWLVTGGLVWVLLITFFRATRWPNDWAEAHWLIDYDFGFIKRALPGTLLKPFLDFGGFGQSAETAIAVASVVILAALGWTLLRMGLRIVRLSEFDFRAVLVIGAVLISPFVVMSAHTIGYFDSLIFVLTAWSCWLAFRGYTWAAAVVLSVGLLVHESIILVGLPSILFAAVLRRSNDADRAAQPVQLFGGVIPFALPILIFLALVINQTYFLDPEQTAIHMTGHLQKFSFVESGMSEFVPKMYTVSFFDLVRDQFQYFANRLIQWQQMIRVFPTIAIIFLYAWNLIQGRPHSGRIIAAGIVISLAPLALLAIAWDNCRIWTYPLMVAYLNLWTIAEVYSETKTVRSGSPAFSLICFIVIMINIFISTPLLDGLAERYGPERRVVYYLPFLIIVVMMFVKNFRIRNDRL
jgi:hypothetical protein